MTRDFLKNLGLEDAAIDKILDENMRDIGKEKSNAATAQTALTEANEKLETATKELEGLRKSSGDVAGLQQQLKDLQDKYNSDIAERDAKLADRDYSDAITKAIAGKGLKFSSKSAERAFVSALKDQKLELKDGELAGMDDFIKAQKEADPDAFAPEKPTPRLVAPTGSGGTPGEPVPANVARATQMGAARAAAMKASADAMKNFM